MESVHSIQSLAGDSALLSTCQNIIAKWEATLLKTSWDFGYSKAKRDDDWLNYGMVVREWAKVTCEAYRDIRRKNQYTMRLNNEQGKISKSKEREDESESFVNHYKQEIQQEKSRQRRKDESKKMAAIYLHRKWGNMI